MALSVDDLLKIPQKDPSKPISHQAHDIALNMVDRLQDRNEELQRRVETLERSLRNAANELVELACTCTGKTEHHTKDCGGRSVSEKYFKLLKNQV